MGLIQNALPSIIFIICGIALKLWAPEEVSGIFGYRTFFSMKNKETWKEGNEFSAMMMIVSGIICLLLSLTITFFYKDDPSISRKISGIVTVILVLGSIFYTEIHLKKVFDKDGNRRIL